MKKAFTLIELLASIAILMVLMVLTVGIVNGVRTKMRAVHTRNSIAFISQALAIYAHQTNNYPIITSMNNQYKLYHALVTPLEITDFKGNVIKKIKRSFLNPAEMIKEGLIEQDSDNPDHYYILDSWGGRIIYMFGEVLDNSGYSYNDRRVEKDDVFYNVNSPSNFDLVSYGKDQLSSDEQTKKDDITNF